MNTDNDYQDIFLLKSLMLPITQSEILSIGSSSNYLLIVNRKNELFKWVFDQEDSLKTPFVLPLIEKEKGYNAKIFCDNKSCHSIIRYNKSYVYFNSKFNKTKLLPKLADLTILSIAFDEKALENSPNNILLGTDKGRIFSYSFLYDIKGDRIVNEILVELIQLKQEKPIYGLAVSILNIFKL